jgi:hypothetical protein
MKNTDVIKHSIFAVCIKAVEEEAKKLVSKIEFEYQGLNEPIHLGKAEARHELTKLAEDLLLLTLFGKGQKALIAEFGRGSLMDRDNPALEEYINGDIFNRERLKYNMAILTRPKDISYRDLDDNEYIRKPPKVLTNLETKKPKYAPVEPKYVLISTLIQNLDSVIDNILLAVTTQVALEKMFDGMKLKVVL